MPSLLMIGVLELNKGVGMCIIRQPHGPGRPSASSEFRTKSGAVRTGSPKTNAKLKKGHT